MGTSSDGAANFAPSVFAAMTFGSVRSTIEAAERNAGVKSSGTLRLRAFLRMWQQTGVEASVEAWTAIFDGAHD